MSRLRIFDDTAPDVPLFDSRDGEAIAAELKPIGVTFERWQAAQAVGLERVRRYYTEELMLARYRELYREGTESA